MKKNIIYISGNDSYGVELEIKRWLGVFQSKFGNINIDRYDLSDGTSLRWIGETILMGGLFAEKRLFIFRGGRDRKSKALWIENILEEKIWNIPDEHFLLFHDISEKEEWLIDWLAINADNRKIDTLWDKKIWADRTSLDENTVKIILHIYREAELRREKWDSNNLLGHNIANTIRMISLLQEAWKKLDNSEIIWLCHEYSWDTMYSLVDAIMGLNIHLSIEIFHRIVSSSDVDKLLRSLISLLRNNLYIKYLKHHWLTESDIVNILKIHPYKIKLCYSSRITYITLKDIYEKLLASSIAYKRGKWLKDSELWRILSIELALLGLQKSKNT